MVKLALEKNDHDYYYCHDVRFLYFLFYEIGFYVMCPFSFPPFIRRISFLLLHGFVNV